MSDDGAGTVKNTSVKVTAGLLSGLTQSLLFNPWDRALYLSVKEDRRFLHPRNFRNPWRGASQSLGHRALSSGMYWPLVDWLLPHARSAVGRTTAAATTTTSSNSSSSSSTGGTHEMLAKLLAGNGAGAINGAALNWIAATKYRMWGAPETPGGNLFWSTIVRMWRNGGARPFCMGLGPTVARDSVFGGVFMGLRHGLMVLVEQREGNSGNTGGGGPLSQSVAVSLAAGACATTASAPLNYARNMQFATSSKEPAQSTIALLRGLARQAKVEPRPWLFLQRRLRVGWGTLRVAVGMATGFELYALYTRLLARVEVERH